MQFLYGARAVELAEDSVRVVRWVKGFAVIGAATILTACNPFGGKAPAPQPIAPAALEAAADGPRFALLIGNEAYGTPGLAKLDDPHQDIERVAEALQAAGFARENIIVLKDRNRGETIKAISEFSARLGAAGSDAIGFFYYSGHGGSAERDFKRDNYIVPVREDIQYADDLEAFGVSLKDQIGKLQTSGAGSVFVVIDACRNTLSWRGTQAGAVTKGIRREDFNPTGMMLLFAAGDGEFADDDAVFSTILSEEIRRSGQDALKAFSRVSQRVGDVKAVKGRTPPILIPQLRKDVCFVSCTNAPAPIAASASEENEYGPTVTQAAGVCGAVTATLVFPFDKTTATLESQSILEEAMRKAQECPVRAINIEAHEDKGHSSAAYAQGVSQRRASGVASELVAAGFDGGQISQSAFGDTRPLQPDKRSPVNRRVVVKFEMEGAVATSASSPESSTVPPVSPPKANSQATAPGTVFRDAFKSGGGQGPEMVVIPAGTYLQGSPSTEAGRREAEDDVAGEGGKPRSVTIDYDFAVSRTELTIDQYRVFATATRRAAGVNCEMVGLDFSMESADASWKNVDFPQAGDHPVVCVSWKDTQAYVRWLSEATGAEYRLLSEAEWEYAARARTTGAYWWGGTMSHDHANDRGLTTVSDPWDYTSPGGSFPANAFGLQDMHGNVWEWVEDCYQNSYSGSPSDGSAKSNGDCSSRVIRGGAWDNSKQYLRSAHRAFESPEGMASNIGFRIARALPP